MYEINPQSVQKMRTGDDSFFSESSGESDRAPAQDTSLEQYLPLVQQILYRMGYFSLSVWFIKKIGFKGFGWATYGDLWSYNLYKIQYW